MSKPVLYIFAGANGSGKTTVAKQFTQLMKVPFINADEIAFQITGQVDQSLFSAGKEFLNQVHTAITKKEDVAIESTLSGKTLSVVIKKAKKGGFKVHTFYLFLDKPTMNIERVRIRVQAGGHHIPDEDVIRRFHRSLHNFWYHYRELSDVWDLMYNSSDRLIGVSYGNSIDEETVLDSNLKALFMEGLNEKA